MTEYHLSKQIIDWIAAQPGCHARKVHSGGMDGRGEPDIMAVVRGYPIFVETKLPKGGEPTSIQKYCLQRWRAAGAVAITATSLEDVQKIVEGLQDE